ncbi:hypothetical protein ABW21_db0206602 [Orbilia brochopaga]|nr:hypothetical protein ABW21_db0206602 [Drechslerella brochopaga]
MVMRQRRAGEERSKWSEKHADGGVRGSREAAHAPSSGLPVEILRDIGTAVDATLNALVCKHSSTPHRHLPPSGPDTRSPPKRYSRGSMYAGSTSSGRKEASIGPVDELTGGRAATTENAWTRSSWRNMQSVGIPLTICWVRKRERYAVLTVQGGSILVAPWV